MYNVDYNIERLIRKRNFEVLNSLSPIKRFSKKFKLCLEEVNLQIRPEDEIAGWFTVEAAEEENLRFDDCNISENDREIIEAPRKFSAAVSVDRGHTLIDYEAVLKRGLVYYEEKINCELLRSPENEYLNAMKDSIFAIKDFTARLCRNISEIAESADSKMRERLRETEKMLSRVPYYPARSFREAVQSVWIIHFAVPIAENSWASISLGKFDEYMYPYYEKSLKNGMTVAEAKKILCNFYALLNSYCDGACLLNVGPEYNELSRLIIGCQKELSMPAPILGARIDSDTPEDIWNLLIDERLFSMGQPTFYGERSCIAALEEKGLPTDIAERFSNNSCMGIAIAGNEFNSMWGCSVKIPAILEAAVNEGSLLSPERDFKIDGMKAPKTLDELWRGFELCAEKMLDICAAAYEKSAELSERNEPDCFVSLLTEGCIEKHCDRISGARYHNVTVECFGMINAADGICAIDKLVFNERKYTLDEINLAVQNGFAGFEKIKSDILSCPKFGENSDADEYAVTVAEILQRVIRKHSRGNIYYSPSLHTLDSNVRQGADWGAGHDGRAAGEPFAKNAGPTNTVRSGNPTSAILSSSKLPQHKFFGGQPIDISFGTDTVRNHKTELKTLIKTYFERGGLQLQVNALSSRVLKDAVENPQKYTQLVIRVGGYSLYFNSLSLKSKLELIERVEKEGN